MMRKRTMERKERKSMEKSMETKTIRPMVWGKEVTKTQMRMTHLPKRGRSDSLEIKHEV